MVDEIEARDKYDHAIRKLRHDYEYETQVSLNSHIDEPIMTQYCCGDGVETHWKTQYIPTRIVGIKDRLYQPLGLTAIIEGEYVVIKPPIPEGVTIRFDYQF